MATVRAERGYLYLDYHDEAGKRHREALLLKDTRENRKEAELRRKRLSMSWEQGCILRKLRETRINNITLRQGYDEFRAN